MAVTITHNLTCSNDFPNEFPNEWEYAVQMYTKIWTEFYQYWYDLAKSGTTPCYFIRFEDLLANKKQVMGEVLTFMLGTTSIDGTYIEKRIDTVLNDESAGVLYKPRKGKANSNLQYFSPQQLEFIRSSARHYINFFGYSKTEGQENPTGFFDFADMTDDEKQV
jgi:hypothetical protein